MWKEGEGMHQKTWNEKMTKSDSERRPTAKTLAKQKRFAQEYAVDRNATRAAIAAGYSEKSAKSAGHRLLTYVDVKAIISEIDKKIEEECLHTAADIRRDAIELPFYDIRDLFSENGAFKGISELTYEQQKMVKKVRSAEMFEGFGKDKVKIGDLVEVEFVDRLSALRLGAQITQQLVQKVEVSAQRNLGEEMREAEQRVKEEREKVKKGVSHDL